jgi:fused signal recognition particle receptor
VQGVAPARPSSYLCCVAERGDDTEPSDPMSGSKPHDPTAASPSEGRPDFANAADQGSGAAPTATEATPDLPSGATLPDELAGASLQPVEGRDPEGGPPGEPDRAPGTSGHTGG